MTKVKLNERVDEELQLNTFFDMISLTGAHGNLQSHLLKPFYLQDRNKPLKESITNNLVFILRTMHFFFFFLNEATGFE